MGRYCLKEGKFTRAEAGEELHIHKFPHTTAVVNKDEVPVCISHAGCMLELMMVTGMTPCTVFGLPVIEAGSHDDFNCNDLKPGQTASYEIRGEGRGEHDVVTLENGKEIELNDLAGCTFRIIKDSIPERPY